MGLYSSVACTDFLSGDITFAWSSSVQALDNLCDVKGYSKFDKTKTSRDFMGFKTPVDLKLREHSYKWVCFINLLYYLYGEIPLNELDTDYNKRHMQQALYDQLHMIQDTKGLSMLVSHAKSYISDYLTCLNIMRDGADNTLNIDEIDWGEQAKMLERACMNVSTNPCDEEKTRFKTRKESVKDFFLLRNDFKSEALFIVWFLGGLLDLYRSGIFIPERSEAKKEIKKLMKTIIGKKVTHITEEPDGSYSTKKSLVIDYEAVSAIIAYCAVATYDRVSSLASQCIYQDDETKADNKKRLLLLLPNNCRIILEELQSIIDASVETRKQNDDETNVNTSTIVIDEFANLMAEFRNPVSHTFYLNVAERHTLTGKRSVYDDNDTMAQVQLRDIVEKLHDICASQDNSAQNESHNQHNDNDNKDAKTARTHNELQQNKETGTESRRPSTSSTLVPRKLKQKVNEAYKKRMLAMESFLSKREHEQKRPQSNMLPQDKEAEQMVTKGHDDEAKSKDISELKREMILEDACVPKKNTQTNGSQKDNTEKELSTSKKNEHIPQEIKAAHEKPLDTKQQEHTQQKKDSAEHKVCDTNAQRHTGQKQELKKEEISDEQKRQELLLKERQDRMNKLKKAQEASTQQELQKQGRIHLECEKINQKIQAQLQQLKQARLERERGEQIKQLQKEQAELEAKRKEIVRQFQEAPYESSVYEHEEEKSHTHNDAKNNAQNTGQKPHENKTQSKLEDNSKTKKTRQSAIAANKKKKYH